MEAAAAQGISVFVASGDAGAYDCQHADRNVTYVVSGIPASSTGVIAVGGTLLSVRSDGSYLDEWGWEDILSGGGTGGGLSRVEERPPWQVGPGVENQYSNGKRQVPDVAGPADPTAEYSSSRAASPPLSVAPAPRRRSGPAQWSWRGNSPNARAPGGLAT